jgi:hypothetical protein
MTSGVVPPSLGGAYEGGTMMNFDLSAMVQRATADEL